ncbi:hypothetical protein ACH5RR_006769 [Cinchona calisaya]|uniref:Uncharacterized protein n=1 Tax=Cinchona calisaya TaxID=153742 RepID=A0ABD3APZ6_9GENT
MSSGCDWCIRALYDETLDVWKVTKWVDDHLCLGDITRNNNQSLTSAVIASHIVHLVKNDPGHKVKQIQVHIKDKLKVDVTYKKAWYARRKAIELVYGSWATNFAQLPQFVEPLV